MCGLGGGNFASSMANISFFYPQNQKGGAMGMNAGLGNLGVSAMQLLGPLVIATSLFGPIGGSPLTVQTGQLAGESLWLQNAAFLWVPLIILASLAAWFGMSDIGDAKASFREQAVIFRRADNWRMSWLYLGMFGSFIGFAAGFPLLSGMQFPDVDPVKYAFLGPLLGALARPVGGMLADRWGGATVTLWTFTVMMAGVVGVMMFTPSTGAAGNFWGFFGCFLVLFVASGIGNGSTFRMVPVIFRNRLRREMPDNAEAAQKAANRESAAVLGFISAMAAYGGFFIPKSYGTAIELTGGVTAAFISFLVFYASCLVMTWWYYARRNAPAPC
jgi:NNP family nitrate/nitrite transporter-like MFS transporter